VPILLGWNSNEAGKFVGRETRASYAASMKEAFGGMTPALLRLYPALDDSDATRAAVELISDTDFGWRSWSLAQARSVKGSPPLFLYQFDNSPPGADGSRTKGALHSDELRYVWGNDDPTGKWPAADKALEAAVQTYWVNFARTGDPNGPGLAHWAPYSRERTALWFRDGKAEGGTVLREEKLQQMDQALQDRGR
jgi:para-nitrobenzyl esterase